MTKQEALSLIKQVASVYRGTLQEHQMLQEAIKTLENESISVESKDRKSDNARNESK